MDYGLNLFAYCGNNPIMGYDPEGTWNWGRFWKGVVVVGIMAAATTAIVLGAVTFGATTVGGAALLSYGTIVAANMLEVAVTQGKKSASDGESFSEGAADVIDAMFANSGDIIIGKTSFLAGIIGTDIAGYQIATKVPLIKNIITNGSMYLPSSNGLLVNSASSQIMGFLKSKPTTLSKAGMATGYLFAGISVFQLGKAIFTTPDFENSKWRLY
ncbi:MAG: hypothetical protein PHT03_07325 [Bacilli bacterium]|nr:hypothetical protein [Bacilli bacterium]